MSSINKPYIINLYEDQLVDNEFKEYFVLTIGSDTMDSQNRAMSPKFTKNINGTNTLTFTMYYKYIDTMTGNEVENPFIPYITNERKVKLKLDNDDNKWYDLIIKDIKQNTEKKTFEVTCTDQYVNELSKNGFNIELNTELMNNQGSAQELAKDVMEGTDWDVLPAATEESGIGTSDFIPAFSEENLVRLRVKAAQGIIVYQIIDPVDGAEPTVVSTSIPQNEYVYAFYSSCTSKPYRFQFFYFGTKTEISKSDDRIVTELNCQYYIDYPVFPYDEEADTYNFYVPTDDFEVVPNWDQSKKNSWDYTSSIGICVNIRGRRYNYVNDGEYNSLFEEYLTPYLLNDTEYLCRNQTKYITPNLVQDLVTNPNTFKSSSGWKICKFGAASDKRLQVESYNGQNKLTDKLIEGNLDGTIEWTPNLVAKQKSGTGYYDADAVLGEDDVLVNTGWYDNRKLLEEEIIKGKQFIVEFTGYDSEGEPITVPVSEENTDPFSIEIANHHYNAAGGYYVRKDVISTYEDGILTLTKSLSKEDFLKDKYAIFITCDSLQDGLQRVEKLSIYPLYRDKNGVLIKPGSEENLDENSIIDQRYRLYNAAQVQHEIETNGSLDNLIPDYEFYTGMKKDSHPEPEYNGFLPVLSCEKVRNIDIKESNYFNILQEISEKFEAWVEFKFSRASDGSIQNKYILFHNYIGQENYAGIKYGINLKSIQRTDDSKQIVTKLIVKQNSNEFGKNGFSTIVRAPSNETGDNSIYNMDYYIQQGLLSAEDWQESIYDTNEAQGKDAFSYPNKYDYLDQQQVERIKNIQINNNILVLPKENIKYNTLYLTLQVEAWSLLSHGINCIWVPKRLQSIGDQNIGNGFGLIIYYEGTENEFREIGVGVNGNNGWNNATVYYNYSYKDFIKKFNNSNGYYVRLRNLNSKLDALGTKLEQFYLPYTQAKANLEKYQTAYDAAVQTLEEESDKFYNALGFDWRGIGNEDKDNSYVKDYSYCSGPKSEQKWRISNVNWEYIQNELSMEPQTLVLTWHSNGSYSLVYNQVIHWYKEENDETLPPEYGDITDIVTKQVSPALEGETYLLIYNGGTTDYESRQQKLSSPQFRPYLVNVATAYQQVQQFESKLATAKTEEEKYKALYDQLLADQKEIIDQKVELNKAFYRKYNRFIQEGTWISEDYYDDEKYYQDSLSVLYNSCYPKVSYTINALELSQLPGYEDFTFKIGDRTYIEDPEFFGYIYNEDLDIDTPYRELVTLTEITYNLDESDKNTIKVQNYKNAFQDLFHRISATVQSVQYSTGAYERAAELAEADTAHKVQYLTDALNSAAMILQNMGDQTVTWDNTGITVQDSQEQNNLLRIVSRGILLSEDGGENWRVGITAKGISADVITTGVLNTETINIMNGSEPTFVWNSYGLTAYDFEGSPEAGTYFKVDTSKGVRFNKFGIYGFNGIEGSSFKPIKQEDIDDVAKFALTWDGLKIYQKNSETHINEAVFYADKWGNLNLKGIITAKGGTIGGWTIGNGSTLRDRYLASSKKSVDSEGAISFSERFVYINPTYRYGTQGYDEKINVRYDQNRFSPVIAVGYGSTANFMVDSWGSLFATSGEIGGCTIENGQLKVPVANITGTITANSLVVKDSSDKDLLRAEYDNVKIGGWNITSDSIYSSNLNNYVALVSSKQNITYCFFAGNSFAASAPFSVQGDGTLTAKRGKIGDWDIHTDYLGTTGNTSYTFFLSQNGKSAWINDHNYEDCVFYSHGDFAVTKDGGLYATKAYIKGTIQAGSIMSGNMNLNRNSLYFSNNAAEQPAQIAVQISESKILIKPGTDTIAGFSSNALYVPMLESIRFMFGGQVYQLYKDGDFVKCQPAPQSVEYPSW